MPLFHKISNGNQHPPTGYGGRIVILKDGVEKNGVELGSFSKPFHSAPPSTKTKQHAKYPTIQAPKFMPPFGDDQP